MIVVINTLCKKEYKMPINIPLNSKHRYVEALIKGYPKYIEAIGLCGNFCMFSQFEQLFKLFNLSNNYTESTINKYTPLLINDLERLGLIGTEYLNKYKYIYLRQPSFALITGDYKNNKRINKSAEMKTGKFLTSLFKIEYLINYDDVFLYKAFNDHLISISKHILELIIKTGNKYKFDTTTIRRIIEVGTYEGVKDIIFNTREKNTRLGIFRFIWGDIGKMFFKFGMQGHNIDNKPLHFKANIQDDGNFTIHYAPTIIIFDKLSGLDYYKTQSNKFFHDFFELQSNKTHKISEVYRNTGTFGYEHFNRIGYTIKIIGSNEDNLQSNINVLNIPYYENNEYTPLVAPCSSIVVDTDKYFKYANKEFLDKNSGFSDVSTNIDNIINIKKKNNSK